MPTENGILVDSSPKTEVVDVDAPVVAGGSESIPKAVLLDGAIAAAPLFVHHVDGPAASDDAVATGQVVTLTNGADLALVAPNTGGGNGRIRTVQTQHGDWRTVDEENIVVLRRSHTPLPADEHQLRQGSVWIQEDAWGRDSDEVSFYCFFLFLGYIVSLNGSALVFCPREPFFILYIIFRLLN